MENDRILWPGLILLTHGVADNATTAFGFIVTGSNAIEGNPIYSSVFAWINANIVLATGLEDTAFLVLGSILTAIVGTAAVAIASTLLYLGWDILERTPGFRPWLALTVGVGVLVPVTNLVIVALETF